MQQHVNGTALIQVMFSKDGNFLYTGARRDSDIFCWDVRYTSGVVYSMQRDTATTNQRIAFDIEPCGRHLATGQRKYHCMPLVAEQLLELGLQPIVVQYSAWTARTLLLHDIHPHHLSHHPGAQPWCAPAAGRYL